MDKFKEKIQSALNKRGFQASIEQIDDSNFIRVCAEKYGLIARTGPFHRAYVISNPDEAAKTAVRQINDKVVLFLKLLFEEEDNGH